MRLNRKEIKPIIVADIIEARDKTGISMLDLVFINGSALKNKVNEENALEKVDNIPFSLIIRTLNKVPDAIPFEIISKDEMFELMSEYEPGIKKRHFSIYLGLGHWSGLNWDRENKEPSQRVQKQFIIIKKLIDMLGMDGWEIWKESLEEEAIARGTTFEKVIEKGTWAVD